MLRRPVAVGFARIATRLVGTAHHQGTALPGLVAQRVWPDVLAELARQLATTVLVVGTNGKTTTAGLIAEMLTRSDGEPIANRSGANLRQGLVTSLVRASDLRGRLVRGVDGPPIAVFEVDEATLAHVLPDLGPAVVVATNLFRDQLDRFGEPDAVVDAWDAALGTAAEGSRLVYCADDPRLAMLAAGSSLPAMSFGLAAMPADRDQRPGSAGVVADPVACRHCGRQLVYAWRSIGHLGAFACPAGHIERRGADVAIESRPLGRTTEQSVTAAEVTIERDGTIAQTVVRTSLPGLSNAYNVAAAIAAGVTLGGDVNAITRAIEGYDGAFARHEWLTIDGRHVVMLLIKNPVSLAEMVRLGPSLDPDVVLLGLNDAPADGRDVSWVWDAPIAPLVAGRQVVLTGSRSEDLRLRLKYDDDHSTRPPASIDARGSLDEALDVAIRRAPRDGVVVVAATYTALMGLRAVAHRQGYASTAPR